MQKYLDWSGLADRMSKAPAKIMGLESKGEVAEGMDADITIIDPQSEWTVTAEDFISKAHNSPFLGKQLKGRVKVTVCNGKVTYAE